MKRLIFTLLVSIAATFYAAADPTWIKDLWYDGGNAATITWADTKFFNASDFSGVKVGDYIQIDITSSTGLIELKSNGSFLPGTVKCDKPNGGGAYTYKAYITVDMLAALQTYGLLVCGAEFKTIGIKIFNDGSVMPEGAIWAGYTWVPNNDSWPDDFVLFKQAFEGHSNAKYLYIYHEAGHTSYAFNMRTSWDDSALKLATDSEGRKFNNYAMFTLADGVLTSLLENGDLSTVFLQRHSDGSAFNITSIALSDVPNAHIRGNFTKIGDTTWELVDDYKFTYDAESASYILKVNGTLNAGDDFKVYLDDDTWLGYNSFTKIADSAEALEVGNDSNLKVKDGISLVNPVFSVKNIGTAWYLSVVSGEAETDVPFVSNYNEISCFFESFNATAPRIWVWDDSNNYTGNDWNNRPSMTRVAITAEGKYLYKWTYSGTLTTVPANVKFDDGSDLAFVNHGYYVDGSYSRTIQSYYGVHGTIFGNDSWETVNLVEQDGKFVTTMVLKDGEFGVKSMKSNGAQSGWYGYGTANHSIAADENLTLTNSNTQNIHSSLTGLYTITLDPVAMTITFTPVANIPATIQAVPNAAANYNAFQINVADYFVTRSGEYSLSNGSYSATSTDGSFTNVPYSESTYTISYATLSAAVAIAQPSFTAADFNAYNVTPELVESVTPGKANLFVKVKATSGYYYALPQAVCKVDGAACDNVTVAWNSSKDQSAYDFAITVHDVVSITKDDETITVNDEKTFDVSITPQYPFAVVAPASAEAPRRAAGVPTALFAGVEVGFEPITVTQSTEVSGVEGVQVESQDAPVEYYNLQGQRVNGELTPGCYIRRQGSSVTKVMIRF